MTSDVASPDSRVRVETYLKVGDDFCPFRDVVAYIGEPEHIPGSIELVVDGEVLLPRELWDDVDWFWLLFIRALDDCRRTGSGTCSYPDQPITFTAEGERRPPGRVLLTLDYHDGHPRRAVAPAEELYSAIAVAGLEFYRELPRVVTGPAGWLPGELEVAMLRAWRQEDQG